MDNFDAKTYLQVNPDLKQELENSTNIDIKNHFMNYGVFENRYYQVQKTTCQRHILLLCHVGSVSTFKKMEHYIDNAVNAISDTCSIHVVLNLVNSLSENEINYVKNRFPGLEIRVNKNFGFDIGGFFLYLKKCKDEGINFDYVIKIHTKTSDEEREKLIKPLLGSVNRIRYIVDLFNNEKVGLVGSQECMFYNYDKLAVHNYNHLSYLLKKFNLKSPPQLVLPFVGGTVFWIRFSILKKVFFNSGS